MSFRYCEIAPDPALVPFINCFWLMEEPGLSTVTDRTMPDGCVELLFHLRNRVERMTADGQTQLNPQVELIGQQLQTYSVRLPGGNQVLGVRFFPHTFSFFSRVPLSYFTNQVLDAPLALGASFHELARQVLSADSGGTAIRLLEAYFKRQLTLQPFDARHRLADFAVRWLLQTGPTSQVDQLTRQTGVTIRHLQQTFEERVGISPKLFQKIIRFQRTFQHLANPNKSLTEVAYESGYYDQSHFIRDFKLLAGVLPSTYRHEPAPINTYCLAESSTSYLYNFR